MCLTGVSRHETPEVISFLAVKVLLGGELTDLGFQFLDVLGSFALLFFPALAEAVGGGGVTLAFLVSDLRRSLHVHRYLNGTMIGVQRHHLIRALGCRGTAHRPVVVTIIVIVSAAAEPVGERGHSAVG